MFDKKLFLQHLNKDPLTEGYRPIRTTPAKKAEQDARAAKVPISHNKIKNAVSDHLGISPDHPDWENVVAANASGDVPADVYAKHVYKALGDHVENKSEFLTTVAALHRKFVPKRYM
tara:strand:+ start:172 stop:522 length:351 start_codon:yes stop_codon:yes gene_type:complete